MILILIIHAVIEGSESNSKISVEEGVIGPLSLANDLSLDLVSNTPVSLPEVVLK